MESTYPYVSVRAEDTTAYETGCVVELRFRDGAVPLPGATEQGVVDAVKAYLAQDPNVAVQGTRYDVTFSPA